MKRRQLGWSLTNALLLAGIAACTTPNPNYRPPHVDAGTDASGSSDTMPDTKTVIRASLSGNDGADGITAPVKTIKRAIEIATGNGAIGTISLEPGRYDAANGELFPYTVPPGVKILGATGTILAGTNTEVGLVVDTGAVENLELNEFNTAIHATSSATLTSVTVKNSKVGVVADGAAIVKATSLTFVGDPTCSSTGLLALGTSQVTVDTLVSTDTMSVDERDQANVSILKGTMTSKTSNCAPHIKARGKSLTLSDTLISGGVGGIWLNYDKNSSITPNRLLGVNLTNTTIADLSETAMIGGVYELRMTGGEIRNNGGNGSAVTGGALTFTGVSLKGNYYGGISIDGGET